MFLGHPKEPWGRNERRISEILQSILFPHIAHQISPIIPSINLLDQSPQVFSAHCRTSEKIMKRAVQEQAQTGLSRSIILLLHYSRGLFHIAHVTGKPRLGVEAVASR